MPRNTGTHHPYDAEEAAYYRDIAARYNDIKQDVDDVAPDSDDGSVSNTTEIAFLFSGWLSTRLANRGLNGSDSVPDVADARTYTWFDNHIAKTYQQGREAAQRLLESAGYGRASTPTLANSTFHQDALRHVFDQQRTYLSQLSGDLEREVQSAAFQALQDPDATIADAKAAIRDRIEKTGKYRGRLIAETETSRAFNEALVAEYEEAGVDEVTVEEVDWITAGDQHVCADCAQMSGTYSLREAKQMLRNGTFPHHPRCRCLLVPA